MIPTRRPASRPARVASTLAVALAVTLLGACASETDVGGNDTSSGEESAETDGGATEEPTDDGEQEGLPDVATMELAAGAHGLGLPPDMDAPAQGGTGAAWSAEPGLLYVVTYGSSTCPLLAEADAAVEGSDAVVTFDEVPADAVCTMDFVPAASVVQVPDDIDPSAEVGVVLGDRGSVVLPPAADGTTGESVWVEE
jgi:hypothetical protein